MKVTQKELKILFSYDQDTGEFIWLKSGVRGGRQIAGRKAGTLGFDGYIEICINKKRYKAHRLAWLYVHGKWPSRSLDHKNCIRHDNRIGNLREAFHYQNLANCRKSKANTSGFKGVTLHKRTGKWWTAIMINGKRHYLGLYKTPEEAHAAYMKAARSNLGEFARGA
jgi:hypothetical protein